ncbi:hypothetical protein IAQ61_008968 [Plenodomus lingam]|uniref:uncharacterized protein n=1 Tax=Leptosphaeria maculans TaxID=5022 RepID=UPI003316C50B|nr:hypothetical protein IAQ61_008968 [Plenodomus lingam]
MIVLNNNHTGAPRPNQHSLTSLHHPAFSLPILSINSNTSLLPVGLIKHARAAHSHKKSLYSSYPGGNTGFLNLSPSSPTTTGLTAPLPTSLK